MQRKHVENGCVPVLRTVAHLFTLALRIYIKLHKDSAVCLQKCYCAKSKQHFIHVQKIQSDMLVTHSSRKPQGLVSGLGNLKPVSQ